MFLTFVRDRKIESIILVGLFGLIMAIRPLFFPVEIYQGNYVNQPLYDYLFRFISEYGFLNRLFGLLFIYFIGFILIRFNTEFNFISNQTFFAAIIYLLIIGAYPEIIFLSPVLISTLFFVLALWRLFRSFKSKNFVKESFFYGFYLSLGSLFYFQLTFYLIIIWAGMFILNTLNFRSFVSTLIGYIVPYLFVFTYYFYVEGLQEYYSLMEQSLRQPTMIIIGRSLFHVVFNAFLVLLILFASVFMIQKFPNIRVDTRKYFMIFFWIFALSVFIILTLPSSGLQVIFIFTIPVTYVVSYYFSLMRNTRFGEVIFSLLVIVSALSHILS